MAIAFVTFGKATATANTKVNLTYTPMANNLLVVQFSCYNGTAPTLSISDNLGSPNTYTSIISQAASSANQHVWVVAQASGSATTFTGTASASCSGLNIDIMEFSGCDTSGTLDGTAVGNASAANPIRVPSGVGTYTTAVAGSVLIGCGYTQSAAGTSSYAGDPGGGTWTQGLNNQNAGDGETSCQGYSITVGAQSTAYCSMTIAASNSIGILFAIKAAAAAAATLMGQACL